MKNLEVSVYFSWRKKMKISLNWLNDYVQIGQNAENCAQILSDLGFPTEGIERFDDDTVIDIEVTSNRGDCLSHIGVAREIAAVLDIPLNLPEVSLPNPTRQRLILSMWQSKVPISVKDTPQE